ncbi:MAG: DMT family transporter [Synergistaceae bacterium]|jgi:drug/metabolite transporter (DMT)-like permease|nr:DMT family transporter [Synergistaceae bacterium]
MFRVYCSLFLCSVFGGAGFVFMKNALAAFPSAWFIFWRFFLSTLVLFPFFAKKIRTLSKQTLTDGFVVGGLFFAATLVQVQGIARTDAGRSAFINSTSMVIVPMLQALSARRLPGFQTILGCFVCLFGVGLLTLSKVTGKGDGAAEMLVFAGTCLFAYEVLVFRRRVQRNDPNLLSFVEFGTIALLALPAALFSAHPAADGRAWGGIVYAAVMMNIAMIMVRNSALRRVSATNVSVVNSTQALYGTLFGALLLGEPVTRGFVVSGCLILSGIMLVIFAPRPR